MNKKIFLKSYSEIHIQILYLREVVKKFAMRLVRGTHFQIMFISFKSMVISYESEPS